MGTVIGMIEIFGSQAPGSGNNPAVLAHGISMALYNTAFGLMIAIPALMFYRYFRGLVDAYVLDMEQAADRLVPHLMRFAVPRASLTTSENRRLRATMNFRRPKPESPEINLIPFIDVLLVVIIFLDAVDHVLEVHRAAGRRCRWPTPSRRSIGRTRSSSPSRPTADMPSTASRSMGAAWSC